MRLDRDRFVASRRQRWDQLEQLLAENRKLHRRPPDAISRLASLYRAVSADLMRARALGLGMDVVQHLNSLSSRAHNLLYGARPLSPRALVDFLTRDFPHTLRRNLWPFAIANLLFYGPFLLALATTVLDPSFALKVLPPSALEQMAEAYAQGFEAGRDEATDSAMAGFYVYNNVGIAFRCFATGVLFGFGSVFFLFTNGLTIGTVLGHVIVSGSGENILTFVAGHGAFELTAIVISGAAGLKMGYALVATNGRTRLGSLMSQAPDLARLIAGAALMLLIAAGIEAFWSPSAAPKEVKWLVAVALWSFVFLYLALSGRDLNLTARKLIKSPAAASTKLRRPSTAPGPPSSRRGAEGPHSSPPSVPRSIR